MSIISQNKIIFYKYKHTHAAGKESFSLFVQFQILAQCVLVFLVTCLPIKTKLLNFSP